MDEGERTRLSKFLSFVLRHEPHAIGIELDGAGWASVDTLLEASRSHGTEITRPILEEVVATSPKQRFIFSDDGQHIRAVQGHSVDVDLRYAPTVPPDLLFHGTVETSISAIRTQGLLRLSRHHVHLSLDAATALAVGSRRGRPVVLEVLAKRMHEDGFTFHVSSNGVWLTEHVPPRYIRFPKARR
jgi:putative RNA 2'-phosphotransferase